ncbi:MAG: bifunctional glutamate N-acetyltransferase/amino-acid acetyltransferase ArgJ [Dehalococcoidia bacterium]
MSSDIVFLAEGSITSPRGFLAGAARAGLRRYGHKLDIGIFYSEAPCQVAAVYTSNLVKAAPIQVTQKHLADGKAQAVIANSACANAATGEQGFRDAWEMAQLTAAKLGLSPYDVVVASTGVIGTFLLMPQIREAVSDMELRADGGPDFAQAIMTTDKRPKYGAARFTHDGRDYTVGGVAKGAGMIYPNLATMLCFLTSDAPLAQPFLAACLKEAVDASFNLIDVDSDTSTNDVVAIFANGRAAGETIDSGHPAADRFRAALEMVCLHLARAMMNDAEGATKLIECRVEGAASLADARCAAREVVRSLGVKTAIYGADPNWGRVLAALGNSGARMEEAKTELWLDDQSVYRFGEPQPFDADRARDHLKGRQVLLRAHLGLGDGVATAWGSDFTEEFVRLNSRYTT